MEQERILVVCAASDTRIGRWIRALTCSPVNHCFLIYQSRLWAGWWAAQIGSRGVVKLPAKKVVPAYSSLEFYEYHGDLSAGLRACRGMVGQGYDYLGILGFLIKIMCWRLLGRRIKNPWHRQNKEFCSEFVANVLGAAGVPMFAECDPASLSPGDVRDRIRADGRFIQRRWPE